jgi:hypothetical protein
MNVDDKTLAHLQNDMEDLRNLVSKVLAPYRGEMKTLRQVNLSLQGSVYRKDRDIEALMKLIATKHPESLQDAFGLLVDPSRKNWKKWRDGWLHRLGLTT